MSFIKLTDLDLAGKRVLIRADLNVPVKDGVVTSDARITASMPTVEHCMKAGASVMVMSHRGRPEEGKVDEENSMAPIATVMTEKLGKDVKLIKDYLDGGFEVAAGDLRTRIDRTIAAIVDRHRCIRGRESSARVHRDDTVCRCNPIIPDIVLQRTQTLWSRTVKADRRDQLFSRRCRNC